MLGYSPQSEVSAGHCHTLNPSPLNSKLAQVLLSKPVLRQGFRPRHPQSMQRLSFSASSQPHTASKIQSLAESHVSPSGMGPGAYLIGMFNHSTSRMTEQLGAPTLVTSCSEFTYWAGACMHNSCMGTLKRHARSPRVSLCLTL